MDAWIAITQWHECVRMAKSGIIFEIRNKDGQSMFTRCTLSPPAAPFDWKSPPLEFRAILEPSPQHSEPIPKPSG